MRRFEHFDLQRRLRTIIAQHLWSLRTFVLPKPSSRCPVKFSSNLCCSGDTTRATNYALSNGLLLKSPLHNGGRRLVSRPPSRHGTRRQLALLLSVRCRRHQGTAWIPHTVHHGRLDHHVFPSGKDTVTDCVSAYASYAPLVDILNFLGHDVGTAIRRADLGQFEITQILKFWMFGRNSDAWATWSVAQRHGTTPLSLNERGGEGGDRPSTSRTAPIDNILQHGEATLHHVVACLPASCQDSFVRTLGPPEAREPTKVAGRGLSFPLA